MKFNGSTMRTNGYTKWIILFLVLFVPGLYVFNNFMFGLNYDEDITLKDDDFIAEYEADDPRLIEHIRKHYLIPPNSRETPYNLNNPDGKDFSHKRQSTIVDDILKNKRNGFFFEVGGYDGETYSNSLYFEKYLNWTGILVEPDGANLKRLRSKNRKAWVVKSCVDSGNRPRKMKLWGAMDIGALEPYMTPGRRFLTRLWRPTKTTTVWCFPFYSILLAVNQTKLDYFVLDVEGSEVPVLRSIPWEKVDITVVQMEYMVFGGLYWDRDESAKRRDEMRQFMRETLPQYKEHSVVFLDLIYVKDTDKSNSAR